MKSPGRPRTKAPFASEQYADWEHFEWPAEMVDIARRRTDRLMGWLRGHTLDRIIQSAYLQGLDDGVRAIQAMKPEP